MGVDECKAFVRDGMKYGKGVWIPPRIQV